jgi:hypothetical protein
MWTAAGQILDPIVGMRATNFRFLTGFLEFDWKRLENLSEQNEQEIASKPAAAMSAKADEPQRAIGCQS